MVVGVEGGEVQNGKQEGDGVGQSGEVSSRQTIPFLPPSTEADMSLPT